MNYLGSICIPFLSACNFKIYIVKKPYIINNYVNLINLTESDENDTSPCIHQTLTFLLNNFFQYGSIKQKARNSFRHFCRGCKTLYERINLNKIKNLTQVSLFYQNKITFSNRIMEKDLSHTELFNVHSSDIMPIIDKFVKRN